MMNGTYCGRNASVTELKSQKLRVGLTDFGAGINYISVNTPSGWVQVCLGFDDIAEYVASGTYSGATVGRVANRIGGARFTLGGGKYSLSQNDGGNCLHGGEYGFDKKFFAARPFEGGVEFEYASCDGEMGFPGNLTLRVRYELDGGALTVRYTAWSDKDTLWAPTCHAYFNLNGAGSGDCLGNMLKINAQSYTPIGNGLVPTGKVAPVAGTPFDFTSFAPIGARIGAEDGQLKFAGGYDHNFVLCGGHAATARGDKSGIVLDVYTDMPGLQLYSGNFLKGRAACGVLFPRSGFALEPQYFPNAVNTPGFDAPVLRAGEQKTHYIRYIFG